MPEINLKEIEIIPLRWLPDVKKQWTRLSWYLLITALLFLPGACKKVDENNQTLNQLPTIYTSGDLAYSKSYLVGDTMTLSGKLFIDQPGSRVTVGAAEAEIITSEKLQQSNQAAGVDNFFYDRVKFLITEQMGVGDNVPVSLFANGVSIKGPSVSIRKLAPNSGRTDTTLVVSQIFSWKPSGYEKYKGFDQYGTPVLQPLIAGGTVDKEGQIYFYNPVEVVHGVGTATSDIIVQANDVLGSVNDRFTVQSIYGAAVDFAGKYLYVSARVSDTLDDPNLYFIYRLIRIDLTSKVVVTLNRSVLDQSDPYGSYIVNPGRSEGDIQKLYVLAVNLKTDVNSNLYFLNQFAMDGGNFNQICRLGFDEKVTSLLSGLSNGQPGIKLNYVGNFAIDAAGNYLFVDEQADGPTALYNSVQDELVVDLQAPPSFAYRSYDTDSLTKLNTTSIFLGGLQYLQAQLSPPIQPGNFDYVSGIISNRFLLADGELLLSANLTGLGPQSIFSLDLASNQSYTYAGAENNFSGQDKETGSAKLVDFSNIGFLGQDKLNNIYYFKTALSADGNDYGPVNIFKLARP